MGRQNVGEIMHEDLNHYMQKVSKGDKKAFRYIANYLGDKMYTTAVKLMGSNHAAEAEDAMQIALIKLWQSAPNFKNKGSLEGYVYRILFSTCMDLHRKYTNNKEFSDNYASAKIDLQNDLINREIRGKVLMAIQKLPSSQKKAILLHYFCGYTQKEVSKLLNRSEKGTESLIFRARKKLKNILPKNLDEELFCA